MALHDGNGWVRCRCGHPHWGLHGAAGLVVLRPGAANGPTELLLQLRAAWTHLGGTWGLPGGARDSHEDAVEAALREAHEEVGIDPAQVTVAGSTVGTDHGDWCYVYVLARAERTLAARVVNDESEEVRWVPLDAVADLPLHPALAAAWPGLQGRLAQLSAA